MFNNYKGDWTAFMTMDNIIYNFIINIEDDLLYYKN